MMCWLRLGLIKAKDLVNVWMTVQITKFHFVKFDRNIQVSDVALLGPTSAVADLSAPEGTTDDNVGISPDTILVPLMENKIACLVCEKREVYLFFMNLTDLDKHLNEHHLEVPINWGCRQCCRCFRKLHGVR
jgi:hypothetical protein